MVLSRERPTWWRTAVLSGRGGIRRALKELWLVHPRDLRRKPVRPTDEYPLPLSKLCSIPRLILSLRLLYLRQGRNTDPHLSDHTTEITGLPG